MALGLDYFDGGKSIARALEGVGPENLNFFGPKVSTGTRIFVVDRFFLYGT
jgi:hypothetical protein